MRRNPISSLLLLAALGFGVPAVLASPLPVSELQLQDQIQETASRCASSCVSISSSTRSTQGSGVLVNREAGLVLTAAHVVSHPGEVVRLSFPGQRSSLEARVTILQPDQDLAVLHVPAQLLPQTATAVPIAPRSSGRPDSICLAFGHAGGWDSGRPAPLRLGRIVASPDPSRILTTCRLSPGDSGGPLFTLRGELLAVHSYVDALSPHASHQAVTHLSL